MSALSVRLAWQRCSSLVASTVLLICGLFVFASTGLAVTAPIFTETVPVLDPTDSYGVIWAPVMRSERVIAAALTEDVEDINEFFLLEEDGLLVINRIDRFDDDDVTTVYDGGLDVEELGGPGVQTSRSCFGPIRSTVSNEGVASRHLTIDAGYSYDVEYAPKCGYYPCTRTARGSAIWDGEFSTRTDFFWRSNWGPFSYWTTQSNSGRNWYVSLYSGDRTINYMERSCAFKYFTGIDLSWR